MSSKRRPSEGTMGRTRATKNVGVRLDAETLARVDAIAARRADKEGRPVTRTEAVRELLLLGLPLCEDAFEGKDAELAPAAPPSATKGGPRVRGARRTRKPGRAGERR